MSSEKVDVRFTTRYDVSNVNHAVGVIGSYKYLGSWDPKHALLLEKRGTKGCWSSVVTLPLSRYFEWKLILIDKFTREVQKWEGGSNRWNWIERGPLEFIVGWNTRELIRCSSCCCLVGRCRCTTIYTKLSPPEHLVDITFKIIYSIHDDNEAIALIGSSEFLGGWRPEFSRLFSGTHNPVLIVPLPVNTCCEWKLAILNSRHRNIIRWEKHENRTLNVQTCPLEIGVAWNQAAEVGHKCCWMDSCWVVSPCPCENRYCSYSHKCKDDKSQIGKTRRTKKIVLKERHPESITAHRRNQALLRDKHVHFPDNPVSEVIEAGGSSITSAENIDGLLDLCSGLDEIYQDYSVGNQGEQQVKLVSNIEVRRCNFSKQNLQLGTRKKHDSSFKRMYDQQTRVDGSPFSVPADENTNRGVLSTRETQHQDRRSDSSAFFIPENIAQEIQRQVGNSISDKLHQDKETNNDNMSLQHNSKQNDCYLSPEEKLQLNRERCYYDLSSFEEQLYTQMHNHDYSPSYTLPTTQQTKSGVLSPLENLKQYKHNKYDELSPLETTQPIKQTDKCNLLPLKMPQRYIHTINSDLTPLEKSHPSKQIINGVSSSLMKSQHNDHIHDGDMSPQLHLHTDNEDLLVSKKLCRNYLPYNCDLSQELRKMAQTITCILEKIPLENHSNICSLSMDPVDQINGNSIILGYSEPSRKTKVCHSSLKAVQLSEKMADVNELYSFKRIQPEKKSNHEIPGKISSQPKKLAINGKLSRFEKLDQEKKTYTWQISSLSIIQATKQNTKIELQLPKMLMFDNTLHVDVSVTLKPEPQGDAGHSPAQGEVKFKIYNYGDRSQPANSEVTRRLEKSPPKKITNNRCGELLMQETLEPLIGDSDKLLKRGKTLAENLDTAKYVSTSKSMAQKIQSTYVKLIKLGMVQPEKPVSTENLTIPESIAPKKLVNNDNVSIPDTLEHEIQGNNDHLSILVEKLLTGNMVNVGCLFTQRSLQQYEKARNEDLAFVLLDKIKAEKADVANLTIPEKQVRSCSLSQPELFLKETLATVSDSQLPEKKLSEKLVSSSRMFLRDKIAADKLVSSGDTYLQEKMPARKLIGSGDLSHQEELKASSYNSALLRTKTAENLISVRQNILAEGGVSKGFSRVPKIMPAENIIRNCDTSKPEKFPAKKHLIRSQLSLQEQRQVDKDE